MSVENSLGLRRYRSTAALTPNRGVQIETTSFSWDTGKEILIEQESFKSFDVAQRTLTFRKWMYLGATFLTMNLGTTVGTSMFFPSNESGESAPTYIYFLAGLAVRTGINTLIESMKAKVQLKAIGG